ncbi:MAG: glycosyltransferase [Myxococcota bacterium]
MSDKTVVVVGQHELDYPRNVVNQRLLRGAGYRLELVHSRAPGLLREALLLRGMERMKRRADAFFLTEGSHRFVPLVRTVARRRNTPVLFDPFTSKYGTHVEDRRRYSPRSPGALRCWWMDYSAVRSADHILFDTAEHRDYFDRRYRLRGPSHILEVGVDETVFAPQPRTSAPTFRVLFYGTYIPLQGVEHILAAAKALEDRPDIQFTLIGRGQTYDEVRRTAGHLPHVRFVGPVPPTALVAAVRESDLCLGIFGATEKAGNVVPNKVVQAAAMGRPIVTRRSSAIERYFPPDGGAVLVSPGDGHALAAAIRALADDRGRLGSLADGARRVFEQHFSEAALTQKMAEILRRAGV